MNIKQILNEVFIDYVDSYHGSMVDKDVYGIYKNPTGNDCRDLIKEATEKEVKVSFRIIVNLQSEDVYIANTKILHGKIINAIKGLRELDKKGLLHKGYAQAINSKVIYYSIDEQYIDDDDKYYKKYKEIMNKYFTFKE